MSEHQKREIGNSSYLHVSIGRFRCGICGREFRFAGIDADGVIWYDQDCKCRKPMPT